MKKKILCLLIAIVMVLSMAACGSQPASEGANANAAPASTSGKTYTWVMQSHAGTTYENWALYEEFVENVKAATGGRLTIELYQSGSVCEQGDMVTSCQDGILDCMAYSMGNGVGVFGDIAYLMGASGSPAGLNPDVFMAWSSYEGEELMAKVIDKYNMVLAGVPFCTFAECFCMSNTVMDTLDSFKGITFRTNGMWATMLTEIGANVVTISGGDIYSSFEKGVMDAFEYQGPIGNYNAGFYEICKYAALPGIHSTLAADLFIVNPDSWNEIGPELQAIVKACINDMASKSLGYAAVKNVEALDMLEEKGIEYYYLSDEFMEEIVQLAADIHEKNCAADETYAEIFNSQKEFYYNWNKAFTLQPTGFSVYDIIG